MIPTDEQIDTLTTMLLEAVDDDGEMLVESNATRTRRGFASETAVYLLRLGVTVPAPKRHTISGSDAADDDDL